jgi:serine/threonine-protein kinase RsbW
LPAGPTAAAQGIGLARKFAAERGLAPEAADRLALIVEEWLNNVTEHSGALPGTRIGVKFQSRDGLVRLIVSDSGAPFDPRTVVFEGPNLARGGGAGLALIQAWCRISDYRRLRGRNRVVFDIRRP